MPSFERDIRPLFREDDRREMLYFFDLWNRDDVARDADEILIRLSDGTMPCDGRWPSEQIDQFRQWVAEGCSA